MDKLERGEARTQPPRPQERLSVEDLSDGEGSEEESDSGSESESDISL